MKAVGGKTTTSFLWVQTIAGWATPHMLNQYTAAMEAEEGAIEAFRGVKPFGT